MFPDTSEAIHEIRIDSRYSSCLVSKVHDQQVGDTEPRIRNKTLLTRDFLYKLSKLSGSQVLDVLPQNCRFVRRFGSYVILVVEDSPKIRTILVKLSMERDIERLKKTGKLVEYGFKNFLEKNNSPFRFTLSFPYIVYFVSFYSERNKFVYDRFKVFYRLSPISSFSDYLLVCNLPNLDSSSSACLGDPSSKYLPLAESFYEALEKWWVNSFNGDYTENYRKYDDVPEICSFLTWSYNTNRDPLFVFNIPWIKYTHTVGSLLKSMIVDASGRSEEGGHLTYNNVRAVFVKPQVEIPTEDGPELDNVCDSIFLSNKELSIGEAVIFQGKNYYIYSFLGPKDSLEPTHVNIESEDGNIETVELTKNVLDTFSEQLDKTKFLDSVKLSDKKVIKVGDILCVDFPVKSYRTVEKIRIARDGLVEVKLLNDYYIAKNLEAELIDFKDFSYKSVRLQSGKKYFLTEVKTNSLPISSCFEVKFNQLNNSKDGKLVMEFSLMTGKKYNISVGDDNWNIEPKQKFQHVGKLFRVGRKLLIDSGKTVYSRGNKVLLNGRLELEKNYSSEVAGQEIIKDNKLEIRSFDLDISFSVNDKVVVADWVDPMQMLKVWTVTGFKTDSVDIKLCLEHKMEKKEVTYVNILTGDVEVGLVRKVVNELNGIKVGTKIRAKTTGISCFPKKDINMIVAFIIDTGGPSLVLCSNCCTLWIFDLEENFDLIPPDSKEWNNLQHVPLKLNRIRNQPGDIFVTSTYSKKLYHYMSVKDRGGYSVYFSLQNYSNVGAFWGFESPGYVTSKTRYGFLMPRYSESKEQGFSRRTLFPNFHGLYTEEPRSPMVFRVDRRLIYNV